MEIVKISGLKHDIRAAALKISQLQKKLDNPRTRKVSAYIAEREANREKIAQCLLKLYEYGEIAYVQS